MTDEDQLFLPKSQFPQYALGARLVVETCFQVFAQRYVL
jgi:hypothetical protein